MSQINKLYLVKPNFGNPLVLQPSGLLDFKITVAGKWPEVPGHPNCGQPPSSQQIVNLLTNAKLYLHLLEDGKRILLRVREVPDLSQLRIYDRWRPFAGIATTLYGAGFPVSLQGVDLLMETIEHQGYYMKEGRKVMKTKSVYAQCFDFPIPRRADECHYAAGFRWDCQVRVGVQPQDVPSIDKPILVNLKLGDRINRHAVYIRPTLPSKDNLKFLHVTDTHVSRRNDHIPDILFPPGKANPVARQRFLLRYRNFNDNLRAVIKVANRKARAGQLDFMVITGDIIDYGYDNRWLRPCHQEESNFNKFVDLITGRDGTGEPLCVPLYVVPGNHEYLRNQVPMAIKVDPEVKDEDEYPGLVVLSVLFGGPAAPVLIAEVSAYYTQEFTTFGKWQLSEEEARKVDKAYGVPSKIGAKLALAKLRPRAGQFAEYLESIAYDLDFVLASGPHRLVFLNTGENVGTPKNKKEVMDASGIKGEELLEKKHLLNYLNNEPDCKGIDQWQVDMVKSGLEAAVRDGGCTFVLTHAPLLNLRTEGGSVRDFPLIHKERHRQTSTPPNMITAWLGWLQLMVLRAAATNEDYANKKYIKPEEKEKPLLLKVADFFKEFFDFEHWGEGKIHPDWQGYEHIDWWDQEELKHPCWFAIKNGHKIDENALLTARVLLGYYGFSQARTHYFKTGTREHGLDHGVAAGDESVHALLRMAAGGSDSKHKLDLILSGHTHHVHEFRVELSLSEAADRPNGFIWKGNNTMHTFYRGVDRHIHELGYHHRSGWYHNDLTQKTNAPLGSDIPSAFTWESNNTIHVVYIGTDKHIHELGFSHNSGWHHNDLTKMINALAKDRPFGCAWDDKRSMHVFYQGIDRHIHELGFSHGSGWRHTDLTKQTGAPLAMSRPSAFVWKGNKTMHVIYQGTDYHIHELGYYRRWYHNDLTQKAGAALAKSEPFGYAWEGNNTIHVFYRGMDQHIYELGFNHGSGWYYNNLTQKTGAPIASSKPSGHVREGKQKIFVFYRSMDGHIHELAFSHRSKWYHNDLTMRTGAKTAKDSPSSYDWEANDTMHVVYRGTDSHIHELGYHPRPGWYHNDLTEKTGGPNALRFYADDYSGSLWQENHWPVLVTSSALKRFTSRFREVQVEDGRLISFQMQELMPLSSGKNQGIAEFHRNCGICDMCIQKKHTGWRETWWQIVPGNFATGETHDLLFYDPATGEGEFYKNEGGGDIRTLKRHWGWRKTWSMIIPGNFGGGSYDDLLFYDPEAGEGVFYTTDGRGNISLLKHHRGWRKTWSHIVPGAFGGDDYTDLLFYDQTTGEAAIYSTNGQGNIRLLHLHRGWRKTWSHIVSMPSNPNHVFLFDRTRGEAALRYSSSASREAGKLYLLGRQSGFRRTWTHIVLGDFRGGTSFDDVLFYNAASGDAEFYILVTSGSLMKLLKKHTGWYRNWSLIVAGNFIVDKRKHTDLLFYDRISW